MSFEIPKPRRATATLAVRRRIAATVRELRQQRGWTLEHLARHLDMSLSRLSEIERGQGSFTAEQFVVLLRVFNVPVSHFTGEPQDRTGQIQNALARLGASHLYESIERTPSESLHDLHDTVREALIEGSPRIIAALAPVLVHNIEYLRSLRLFDDVGRLGYLNRLGWVVDNTLVAIDEALSKFPKHRELRDAKLRLGVLAERLGQQRGSLEADDVLDATIRSEKTLEQTRRDSSDVSKAWRVVSSLQPSDFTRALEATLAPD